MLEEVLILGRDEGEPRVFGDRQEWRDGAALVVELADRRAVAVENPARERGAEVRDVVQVGEIAQEARVEPIAAGHQGEPQQHHTQRYDPEPPGPDESHLNSSTYRNLARINRPG